MTDAPKVASNYLSDITGESDLIDFEGLIKSQGLSGLIPDMVTKYADKLDRTTDQGVHQYLCNIDKSPTSCYQSKAIEDREKGRYVGMVQWRIGSPYKLLYSVGGHIIEREIARKQRVKPLQLAKKRKGIGYKERGSNLGRTVVGQGLSVQPEGNYYTKSVKLDRKGDSRQLFKDAVEGKGNLSIGDRAVLFNQDGSITTGANNIRDNAVGIERSSNIPSETISSGRIPKKIKSSQPYKTSNHPNKSRLARTNDLTGGVSALGGIAALIGVLALLLPMHFVTSAITFLTSITTFFTNVNNAINTYLTIADALLGIFGIKGSGAALKSFVTSVVDNALGKKNVQEVKNAFAQGINTIAVTTKLLEKTQAIANNTDNKVDEATLKLGAINNAMGEAGLIPPELMATSKGIDELVETRTENNKDLESNLEELTKEIKTKGETTKELKTEDDARAKLQAKRDKDLRDVTNLINASTTSTDKIIVDNL